MEMHVYDSSGMAPLLGALEGTMVVFIANRDNIALKTIPKLTSRGIPWCAIGGGLETKLPGNCVFINLRQGAEVAMKHLLANGYDTIGYCFSADSETDERMPASNRSFRARAFAAATCFP